MSYSEENGQVILTMSREDYELLRRILLHGSFYHLASNHFPNTPTVGSELLSRLNSGNPNYTPYQVGEKKGVDSRNGLPYITDVD